MMRIGVLAGGVETLTEDGTPPAQRLYITQRTKEQ
jgi:hypothetical protein